MVKIDKKEKFDKQKYDSGYVKKNYHQVMVKMRDDIFTKMSDHISQTKENRTQFIKRAILETIENDNKK